MISGPKASAWLVVSTHAHAGACQSSILHHPVHGVGGCACSRAVHHAGRGSLLHLPGCTERGMAGPLHAWRTLPDALPSMPAPRPCDLQRMRPVPGTLRNTDMASIPSLLGINRTLRRPAGRAARTSWPSAPASPPRCTTCRCMRSRSTRTASCCRRRAPQLRRRRQEACRPACMPAVTTLKACHLSDVTPMLVPGAGSPLM